MEPVGVSLTTAVDPGTDPRPRRSTARDLVVLARPRQWTKNLLVFVAPGAAGSLVHLRPALDAAGAFGIFCAAASASYLLNDAIDAPADRAHPEKRLRPVAAKRVSVRLAVLLALVLFAASMVGAALLEGWQLVVVVALYGALTATYSLRLKREPVIELTAVAAGFVLRAIAGGVATHVELSSWFLVVTSFSALFIVIGKRLGEHAALGAGGSLHRKTLGMYSIEFLRAALTLGAAGAVTTYCLWAFEKGGLVDRGGHLVWVELSVVPVVAGVLYVLRILVDGGGSAPSELALRDHTLQILALLWAVLVGIGVYA